MTRARKLLLMSLAFALIICTCFGGASVLAEDTKETGKIEKTDETELTFTVPVSYTITIPATMSISYNELSNPVDPIVAEDMHVEIGKCVSVTVANANGLAMVNSKDNHKLHYNLQDDEGNVLTEWKLTVNGSVDDINLCISQDEWDEATTGNYSGTATFNIAYTDLD